MNPIRTVAKQLYAAFARHHSESEPTFDQLAPVIQRAWDGVAMEAIKSGPTLATLMTTPGHKPPPPDNI